MAVKSNKEYSFGRLVDQGLDKNEIMKRKNLSSEGYDKAYKSLMEIREEKRKKIESRVIEVIIEGRKGKYKMDMEWKQFTNTETPGDKIYFDTNEEILITSFTCPNCGKFIDKLDYKESGIYNLTLKKGGFVPEKITLQCSLCHTLLDRGVLGAIGVII